MPLLGESAGRGWAHNPNDNPYTASWDIDIPPRAAFIKVFLERYIELDDRCGVGIGLLNIRFRDPNGIDQTISFPGIGTNDVVTTVFNPTMTHVTFGLEVVAADVALVWTLGFWD